MATALIAGAMQIAMGAARLGVLTNFIRQPVLSGFISAAAVHIALSQVKQLLGVPLPRTNHLHELLGELGPGTVAYPLADGRYQHRKCFDAADL